MSCFGLDCLYSVPSMGAIVARLEFGLSKVAVTIWKTKEESIQSNAAKTLMSDFVKVACRAAPLGLSLFIA